MALYQSPLQRYLQSNQDVSNYIKNIKEPGPQQGSGYDEKTWLDLTNKRLGTTFKDAGDFRDEDLARTHYEVWGKGEARGDVLKAIADDRFTQAEHDTLRKQSFDAEYAPKQDLSQFDTLLTKLEATKLKQLAEANRARRGDIYAQGLASMMTNF